MDKQADQSQLTKLRESLIDIIAICERLHCNSVEELLGVAGLAIENDGQARMILALISKK